MFMNGHSVVRPVVKRRLSQCRIELATLMKKTIENVWTPSDTVTRHSTSSHPENLTFFVGPPSEIGTVISADSNLSAASHPLPFGKVLGITICSCAVIGTAAALWFGSIIPLVLGAVTAVLIIVTIAFSFNRHCSFVGEQGICYSTVNYYIPRKPKTKTLLFENAIALYTAQTQNYVNGIYTGTTYNFKWTQKGQPNYPLLGQYRSKTGNPPVGDTFHFAKASESAWTNHLLPIVNQDFKDLGHVDFPMSGKLQTIRMSHQSLEFTLKNGETQAVNVADMKDIKLQGGIFYFNHQDTHWWSGKGKYSFAFSAIPNAQLFMLCLHQVAGLKFV